MITCGGNQCYDLSEKCDGKQDCSNGDDERNCSGCLAGSKKCGKKIVCADHKCGQANAISGHLLLTQSACEQKCDHFWCESEKRCIRRNDPLQGT